MKNLKKLISSILVVTLLAGSAVSLSCSAGKGGKNRSTTSSSLAKNEKKNKDKTSSSGSSKSKKRKVKNNTSNESSQSADTATGTDKNSDSNAVASLLKRPFNWICSKFKKKTEKIETTTSSDTAEVVLQDDEAMTSDSESDDETDVNGRDLDNKEDIITEEAQPRETSKNSPILKNKVKLTLSTDPNQMSACKGKVETLTLNPSLSTPNILKINPAMQFSWNKVVKALERLQTNPESIEKPHSFIAENIYLLNQMECVLNVSPVYSESQKQQIKFDIYNLKSAFELEKKINYPTKNKTIIIISTIATVAIGTISGFCYYYFNK